MFIRWFWLAIVSCLSLSFSVLVSKKSWCASNSCDSETSRAWNSIRNPSTWSPLPTLSPFILPVAEMRPLSPSPYFLTRPSRVVTPTPDHPSQSFTPSLIPSSFVNYNASHLQSSSQTHTQNLRNTESIWNSSRKEELGSWSPHPCPPPPPPLIPPWVRTTKSYSSYKPMTGFMSFISQRFYYFSQYFKNITLIS